MKLATNSSKPSQTLKMAFRLPTSIIDDKTRYSDWYRKLQSKQQVTPKGGTLLSSHTGDLCQFEVLFVTKILEMGCTFVRNILGLGSNFFH